MKKMIISLVSASLLFFTGCFIDSDTATVRINLGNLPVAKVEKKSIIDRFLMIFVKEAVAQSHPEDLGISRIEIEILDGSSVLVEKTILIGDYPSNNIVEIEVPAGTNRLIKISAIDKGGPVPPKVAYGVMITTDLAPGQTKTIQAMMLGVPVISAIIYDPEGTNIEFNLNGYNENWDFQFQVVWSQTIDGDYVEYTGMTGGGEGAFYWNGDSPPSYSGYFKIRAIFNSRNLGLYCEPEGYGF